jgi:hypothetical protein
MPAPYDYSLGNLQDPTQALASGVQFGAGLRQLGVQQQTQDLQLQQAAQQQQFALEQQRQQAQVINSLISKPNASAQDYANASLILPTAMRDQVKQSWEMRNAEQQQSVLQDTGKVFAALSNKQPAVAADLLRQRADMLKSSDPTQAQSLQTMAGVVDAHPEFARALIGMHLASVPGGDKVIANLTTMGAEQRAGDKAPAELAKAQADAYAAQVKAGNTPTEVTLGNEKTAQEIKASQLDGQVKMLNGQIAAANSETERGRLTLERDKLIAEQAKLGQAQGQAAQESQNLASSALSTLSQIKDHPAFKSQEYGGTWSKIKGFIPGTDRQALEGWVDSLKSQLGYQNLMAAKASSPTGASGFGALSEGELKLITNIAGNLDLNSADFPKQLATVERFLQKAQATAVSRPQLPTKGEAYVMRHPTYGNVTEGIVNDLMRKSPGVTRDQVLQFLKSTGGN